MDKKYKILVHSGENMECYIISKEGDLRSLLYLDWRLGPDQRCD